MPSLKWIGKRDIKNHHNEVKYNIIECKENIGDYDTGNMVVKGDNLVALKALLPYYGGKVKMIYIDPPYNTGNTSWVYNDAVDSPIIKKWLSKVVDSNDLSRSDKWLCMIYPRLKLLQQFLREDGVIYISLDDAEVSKLRLIMDEIFGRNNFLCSFVWNSKQGKLGTTDSVAVGHEYVVAYAKNAAKFNFMKIVTVNENEKVERLRQWGQGDRREDRITMFYPLLLSPSGDLTTISDTEYKKLLIDKAQKLFDEDYIQELKDKYEAEGYEVIYPMKENGSYGRWRVGLKKARDLIQDSLLFADYSNKGFREIYRRKIAGNVTETAIDSVLPSFTGKTANGSSLLKEIFENESVFDYPKPISLIEYLIKISQPSDNDLILDSFAGSGTTGHAVLNYNYKNNTSLQFILIEMEEYAKEVTAERLSRVINGYNFKGKAKIPLMDPLKIKPSTLLNPNYMTNLIEEVNLLIEAVKEDYDKIEKKFKDNILEVTGIKEIEDYMPGIGGGFQYCELSEELFDEFGLLNEKVTFKMLAKHIFFTEFGVALKEAQIHEEQSFAGSFKAKALYLFPDKRFTKKDIPKLSKDFEEYIVYADSTTLSNEQLKENRILFKKIPFEIKDK
jgi:adenine-specific DNA-methyltransferase